MAGDPREKVEFIMTTKRKYLAVLSAAAVLAVVMLLGCGGAPAGSAEKSSAADASSASETTATSTAASYTLVEDGKLIVASDLDFPPLDSFEGGEAQGFDVDLSFAIAEKLGLECEYLPPQNFDTIIPLIVQGGKADIGNSAFSITEERKKEIDFTSAYLDSNLGVATKKDSAAKDEVSLNDAEKKIAVQSGTTGEAWARENLGSASIVPLNTVTECMAGLTSGLYDAVCADLPVISNQCTVSFTDCEVAMEIPTGEQYGIVVSKDNPELTAAIDAALAELESDGTMKQLKEKWFGGSI
ncbi:MAG: amino acid ABC transporter substrate-binding protein [Atopobiaceae bacterium]|nr:amino acid ABC transporter substrate-binding protein [Atopobiaceae bacterium]